MTKRAYFNLASSFPTGYLRKCAAQPSGGMRPIHVAIIRLVLRKRGE